jgi:phospholipid/cholesterol/gamma-HCH transport system permease protein
MSSAWQTIKTNRTLRVIYFTLEQIFFIARLGLTFHSIGKNILSFLQIIGGISILYIRTLLALPRPPYRIREIIKQMWVVGWQSVPLIITVLGFMGMITILELNFQLSRVIHDVRFVPGFAGVLMFREFGPTVVAAMMATRVGAGFAAEIGNMKNTEQIDALELLSIDPVHYLAVPRFVANVTMQVALSVIGVFAAFVFGFFISQPRFNFQSYLFTMQNFVGFEDFFNLIGKAFVLGMVVPIVACYYGFRCTGGAKGVGEATTRSVVTSILIIIILAFTMNVVADMLIEVVMDMG